MYALLKDLPIAYLHVFPYSDRPLARSFNFDDKISPEIKKQRSTALIKLSNKKHEDFCKNFLNMTANVLWETKKEDDFISGYTENYIRVFSNFDENLINKISKVRLEKMRIIE